MSGDLAKKFWPPGEGGSCLSLTLRPKHAFFGNMDINPLSFIGRLMPS
jgi:hypothetical protein